MKHRRVVVSMAVLSVLMVLAFIGTRTLLTVPENKERLDQQQFIIEQQRFLIQKLCESDNEQNAKQMVLWQRIFEEVAKNPNTDSTPEQREAFRMFINDTFPQELCP